MSRSSLATNNLASDRVGKPPGAGRHTIGTRPRVGGARGRRPVGVGDESHRRRRMEARLVAPKSAVACALLGAFSRRSSSPQRVGEARARGGYTRVHFSAREI
jgi:hypothetical protein